MSVIRSTSPFRTIQALIDKIGQNELEASTDDEYLSMDPQKPTRLIAKKTFTLPKGETLLDFRSWKPIVLPMSISCSTVSVAEGFLNNGNFSGIFKATLSYSNQASAITLLGRFTVNLV